MFRTIAELWKFRTLAWALTCRHINARYRGSFLGFLWSFLNPLCLIAVYSLVFRYYIRFDSVDNYTLFLFAGLLPWIWFSSGLIEATGSISSGGSLITKAMFPPQILPFVAVLTNLANFVFALPLLIGYMLFSGVDPTASLLMLPLIVFAELLFLFGLGLAFSALNVHYRDIQHILGNLITLWFFLCPILYPLENVPEKFRFTMEFNPVAVFTKMYQGVFLEATIPAAALLAVTLGTSIITFWIGALVFERFREEFAELI